MNRVKIIIGVFLVIATACGEARISQNGESNVSGRVLSLNYVTTTQISPDAKRIPECDGEFLIKVQKNVWSRPSLQGTIDALFRSELMEDAGGSTSALISNKDIFVEDIIVPEEKTGIFRVDLKSKDAPVNNCEASRAHEQITETVRQYAGSSAFQIRLNGSLKEWECLGSSAAYCK